MKLAVRRRNMLMLTGQEFPIPETQSHNTDYFYYRGENSTAWQCTGHDVPASSYDIDHQRFLFERSEGDGIYIETKNKISARGYSILGGKVSLDGFDNSDYFVLALCTNGMIRNVNDSFGRVLSIQVGNSFTSQFLIGG